MALLIGCESLSKTFGPRTLFKGLSFSIAEGERAGLIGANGSGKSTLLKILAGIEHADDGEVTTKRNLRLAYMPQVDMFEEGATVRSVVAEALDAEHHLDEGERLARAGMTLGRVGFRDLDVPVSELSGGWRKRLALAREVAKQPELLLMDEPTNHLDLEGIRWLEEYLAAAPFALLVVSHDRYLLENATTRVVEIGRQYPQGTLSVEGPFSEFLAKREEFLEAQDAEQRALASKVRREIEWLRRGAKARTTKAKGRIEEAGRMMKDLAELKVRNAAATTRAEEFDFTGSDRKTKKLIAVEKVSKSLGGRKLFHDLSFVLGPGMKLGLLGLNGSGKTTLIRVITKQIEPDNGTVKHADWLKVVVFDQARAQLDQSVTLRRALAPNGDKLTYQGQAIHVTGWARRFLFRTEQLDLPVSELSGGEQARVLIAQLMLQPADVLILDEPTNDLDIPSIEVLEDSLEEFPGALVLVTHDRFMLDRLADGFVGLDGRGGAGLYADLGQWERAMEAGEEQAKAAAKAAAAGSSAAPVASKPKKGLTYMEQRELEQIEGKLMAAEEELENSHAEMADPAVMADHKRMAEACERGRVAQEAVDRIYRRWEELEGKRKG